MNSLKTQPKSQPKSKQVDQRQTMDYQPAVIPALDEIVKSICADAQKDALKYALRSDTGHDGE